MDYSNAYAINAGGTWHSVVRATDMGDYIDAQISTYQGIHIPKSQVLGIKVNYPANVRDDARPRFDIDLGTDK